MEEEKKRQVATFRFGVISDLVVAHNLERGERERLIRDKAERQWEIPYSRRTRISASTISLWVRHYERGGRCRDKSLPLQRTSRYRDPPRLGRSLPKSQPSRSRRLDCGRHREISASQC
jgi:hypothetical protein